MDPRGGVYNDFDMQLFTWDEMPKEQLNDLIGRKMVVGEKAMAAQIFIAKGGVVPEHHHEAEQITYILEGALKFHIEGQDIVVNKGQVLVIPSIAGGSWPDGHTLFAPNGECSCCSYCGQEECSCY